MATYKTYKLWASIGFSEEDFLKFFSITCISKSIGAICCHGKSVPKSAKNPYAAFPLPDDALQET